MKFDKTTLYGLGRLMWRNKFYTLCGAFFLYMCFIGEHSLYNIASLQKQEDALKSEIAVYKDSIETFQRRIDEVSVNEEELERYARENLRMHKENEDLYLVK